jgi:hypothetical protein
MAYEKRPLMIRRFHNSNDIVKLEHEHLHEHSGGPYAKERCEWGLLYGYGYLMKPDPTVTLPVVAGQPLASYFEIIDRFRALGIRTVPGMKIGTQPNPTSTGFVVSTDVTLQSHWDDLVSYFKLLLEKVDPEDGRFLFDLEAYDPLNSAEPNWYKMDPAQQAAALHAAAEFTELMQAHNIIPVFHPGTPGIALGEILLKASGGKGTVQSYSESGEEGIMELMFRDERSFHARMFALSQEAQYWKQAYPGVLSSYKTSMAALRRHTMNYIPFVLSADGMAWVDDSAHRDFDGRERFATGDHINYYTDDALDSAANYTDVRPNYMMGLTHAWQFNGLHFPGQPYNATDRQLEFGAGLATKGSNTSAGRGWGPFPTRQGNHAELVAKGSTWTNSEDADRHAYIHAAANLEFTPRFTAIVTFAIDTERCDPTGRNGWERGGILLKHGQTKEKEAGREFFQLTYNREHDDIVFTWWVRIANTTSIPPLTARVRVPYFHVIGDTVAQVGAYMPLKVLVNFGGQKVQLGVLLNGVEYWAQDERLEDVPVAQRFQPLQNTNKLGDAPCCEFISFYTWFGTFASFPSSEWPFNEKRKPDWFAV